MELISPSPQELHSQSQSPDLRSPLPLINETEHQTKKPLLNHKPQLTISTSPNKKEGDNSKHSPALEPQDERNGTDKRKSDAVRYHNSPTHEKKGSEKDPQASPSTPEDYAVRHSISFNRAPSNSVQRNNIAATVSTPYRETSVQSPVGQRTPSTISQEIDFKIRQRRLLINTWFFVILSSAFLTALFAIGAYLKDTQGTRGRSSPFLSVVSGLEGLGFFFGLWLYIKLLRTPVQGIDWYWHDRFSKRLVILIVWITATFMPMLCIFVLHSLHYSFYDLFMDVSGWEISLLSFHIVTAFFVDISCLVIIYFANYTLHTRWPNPHETDYLTCPILTENPFLNSTFYNLSARFLSFFCSLADVALLGSFIWAAGTTGNSGTIVSAVLYGFSMVLHIGQLQYFNVFPHSHYRWWLSFRLITLLHLFCAYFFFWVTLIVILLDHVGYGFWESVNSIIFETRRSLLVYGMLVGFLVFNLASVFSLYVHKVMRPRYSLLSLVRSPAV